MTKPAPKTNHALGDSVDPENSFITVFSIEREKRVRKIRRAVAREMAPRGMKTNAGRKRTAPTDGIRVVKTVEIVQDGC